MSCMGVDVGNQTSVVAVPKGGGIEVILNDYSKRQTPTCVSFGDRMRTIGESGKQRAVTAFKHTVTYLKGLIGRKYKSPDVQAELAKAFYKHKEMPDGTVGVEVDHAGETLVVSVTQLLGMLMSHLRHCAAQDLDTKVDDCVVGVPVHFNDAQRHAMLEALRIANINCLRLMNEPAAVALNYGIYKQGLPAPEEKPRRVVFFDFGHSNLQMSLCDFVKGKLSVITTAHCRVGGRDFDLTLLEEMARRFQEKTKLDFRTKPRPYIRMETECEKLKKMMSTNATSIPMNVECLMEDCDFTTKMNRKEFEELCKPVFDKVQETITSFIKDLEKREISLNDLHSVEIVGGSCRVPLVKQMLTDAFGKTPQTTLNSDEAVARGCALMSAILSPIFRVRDFKLDDTTPYAINLSWSSTNPDEADNQSEIFQPNGSASVTKLLTFYRKDDFEFTATYAHPESVPDQHQLLGNFKIEGVKPSYDEAAQKVKVEVQMDSNGCLNVKSATLLDKIPPEPEEDKEAATTPSEDKADEASKGDGDNDGERSDSGAADESAAKKAETEDSQEEPKKDSKDSDKGKDAKEGKEGEPAKKKKKPKTHKKVPLTVVSTKPWLKADSEINELVETEAKLAVQDIHEQEKNDARNALEEYIYDMRDKLSSMYEEFMTQQDGDAFKSKLMNMEDWLYEDGEDQPKTVYMEKLQDLRATGDDVQSRVRDWEMRPLAEEKLRKAIVLYRKFVDEHAAGDEKYNHIPEEDVKKVADLVASTDDWLNTKSGEQAQLPKSAQPVLTTKDLEGKKQELERVCEPIVNKPKPKVEPPKDEEAKKEGEQSTEGEGNQEQQGEQDGNKQEQQGQQEQDGNKQEQQEQDNVMDTD